MQCVVYCLIGFTLLVAMVWVFMNKSVTRDLEKSLDKYQRKKYHKLVIQRRNNAITGFFIGVVVALAYYYFGGGSGNSSSGSNSSSSSGGGSTQTTMVNSCAMTAIVMTTMIVWYMAMAPEETIRSYLDQDQLYLWMDVNSKMMRNFYIGMLIGFIGFFLLSMGGQDLCTAQLAMD